MFHLDPWPVTAATILIRTLVVIAFLYWLLPRWIFGKGEDDGPNRPVERAIWIAYLLTASVHLLAAIHLYEAAALLLLLLGAGGIERLRQMKPEAMRQIGGQYLGRLFDLIDQPRSVRVHLRLPRWGPPSGWWGLGLWMLLVAVLGVGAWLRFDEAFHSAAPALSDAPINLAWMRYLENNSLYGLNGDTAVYPRGMYAFLSIVRKLAVLNSVEVLDLTGPLVGFLILLSLVYFVYQTTRSPGPAVVVALVYGTLPSLLPYEFDRHAAHNSQEFGMLFVLPAAWAAYAFLLQGRRADRLTAAAAAGMAAFTHPVPTLFVVPAMAATGLVALVTRGRSAWRRLPSLVGWVGTAGVVAAAPVGIALAMGLPWHGSSVAYLQAEVAELPPLPPLYPMVIASGAALLLLGSALAWWRQRRGGDPTALAGHAALAAAAITGLGLYLLPWAGVRLEALAERSVEFAAIGLALAAALAWSLLESLFARRWWIALPTLAVLTATAWYRFPPEPARPYHYYSHQAIIQYLWADRSLTIGEWTLVTGHTGYALALGRSYHQYPQDFIAMADSLPDDPARWIPAAQQSGIGVTPHYLLLVERIIPLAPFQAAEVAKPRLEDAARLEAWVRANQSRLSITQVFDGEEVSAYLLNLPVPKNPYAIYQRTDQTPGPMRR